MQRSPGTYSAGTIQGTAGQPEIIGTGTVWATTDATGAVSYQVAAFDDLVLPGQRPLLILSVDGVGQLTLNENLPFSIPAGSAYKIVRRTPVLSSAVLGTMQQVLKQGSDDSPDLALTFDNSVSRFKVDFDDTGRIRFRVGSTGADGSPAHPYATALIIDPDTGNVTAQGLTAGGGSVSTFNQILNVVGKPPDTVGNPGDYAFDTTTGFVFYGPKGIASWAPGIDVLKAVAGAAASASAAAQSAADAAATLQTAKGTIATAADQGSTQVNATRDQASAQLASLRDQYSSILGSYVAQLRGRVFDFNLSIDPQTQTYAGGQDWNANV